VTRPHDGANAAGLARLRRVVTPLDAAALRRPIGETVWTVSALLEHISFWDRMCMERWDLYDREGGFTDIPESAFDLVNEAAMPGWLSVPSGKAAEHALHFAEATVNRITRLTDTQIEAATRSGRTRMLDRTPHWYEHLEEIEEAL
jgi:uncharacterized damage-inducible protein DinB